MLVSSFNLLQSFNYNPYFFYKKRFKSEINSFCIWTLVQLTISTNTLVLPTLGKCWILHSRGFFFCLVKRLSFLNVCWIVVWKFIGYYNILFRNPWNRIEYLSYKLIWGCFSFQLHLYKNLSNYSVTVKKRSQKYISELQGRRNCSRGEVLLSCQLPAAPEDSYGNQQFKQI
jgi:hypothetical protein